MPEPFAGAEPSLAEEPYRRALSWLYSLVDLERQPMTSATPRQMSLARPAALLRLLGAPQERYRTVLVAGSKGKGSTAAMLATILHAAGHRVGFASKPHLHTFRERIRVDGLPISKADFAEQVERIRPLVSALAASQPDLGAPTTFEVATALALDYFARQEVRIAIIEVGLGGRLDATNVVEADLSLIAPISLEHMAVLGNTLAEIASEKAGIIKVGRPVLSAPQADEALTVLSRTAEARSSPLGVAGIDWTWAGDHAQFEVQAANARPSLWDRPWLHKQLQVALLGAHQLENAANAVAAVEVLEQQYGIAAGHAAIAQGLAETRWPGRLELVRPGGGTEPPVVVDGAHNGDSAERLALGLARHFQFDRLWLVLGVYGDKDLRAIVAPLAPRVAGAWAIKTRQPRSREAAELAGALQQLGLLARPAASMAEALREASSAASPHDLICVTGSLSAVAQAREALGLVPTEEHD